MFATPALRQLDSAYASACGSGPSCAIRQQEDFRERSKLPRLRAAACALSLIIAIPGVASFICGVSTSSTPTPADRCSSSTQLIEDRGRGEQFVGHSIVVTQGATTHTFMFPTTFPATRRRGPAFSGCYPGFRDLCVVTPISSFRTVFSRSPAAPSTRWRVSIVKHVAADGRDPLARRQRKPW